MPAQKCKCGCGQPIAKGMWLPGHDHRAIHSRIRRDHNGVAGFIDWYDRTRREQRPARRPRSGGQMAA